MKFKSSAIIIAFINVIKNPNVIEIPGRTVPERVRRKKLLENDNDHKDARNNDSRLLE